MRFLRRSVLEEWRDLHATLCDAALDLWEMECCDAGISILETSVDEFGWTVENQACKALFEAATASPLAEDPILADSTNTAGLHIRRRVKHLFDTLGG